MSFVENLNRTLPSTAAKSIVFLCMLVKKNSQISHLSQKAYCISNQKKLTFKLLSLSTYRLLKKKPQTNKKPQTQQIPKNPPNNQPPPPQTKQPPKPNPKQNNSFLYMKQTMQF